MDKPIEWAFYLPCFKCGKQMFLYRGLCVECAPMAHAELQAKQEAFNSLALEFSLKTGKNVLADWYAFEKFVDAKIEAAKQVSTA